MIRVLAVKSPAAAAAASSDYDAVVLVGHAPAAAAVPVLTAHLQAAAAADARFASTVNFVAAAGVAGNRLVIAPTGPLGRDHDDVRRDAEAARAGVRRARDAGGRSILLLVQEAPSGATFAEAPAVAALGALGGLWEPLEAREALGAAKAEPVQQRGLAVPGGASD